MGVMPSETLSYAQSLRVIGQDLDALGVRIFNLGKRGDEYTVWAEEEASAMASTENKNFLKKIAQQFIAPTNSNAAGINPIRFVTGDILRADTERRLNRNDSESTLDLIHLSVLMRVLGDYLDKKAADDFSIFWFRNSVKVVYSNKEESFRFDNLYDISVHMYLRRYSHRQV